MALTKYKLGELIEQSDERNSDNKFTLDNVKGISIQKIFIETKANMEGVSLTPYKLVRPDDFAYVTVTSRNGEKITLTHNTTEDTYIVSSSYIVFCVKRTDLLLSNYLFMYFNRTEFDRFSRFNSWGSARETFSWEDFCDIDIDLPPIDIQQKYVDIYNAIALAYGIPGGGEDIDHLAGDLHLGLAKGGEEFLPLGAEESDPALEGEVIYYDQQGAVCRNFNWREAQRTMLTEATKNALLCYETINQEQAARCQEAMAELKPLLEDFFGIDVILHRLNRDQREALLEE